MERGSRTSNAGCKESSRRNVLRKDASSSVEKENNPRPSRKPRTTKLYSVPCGENRGGDENLPNRRVSLSQVEFKPDDSRSSLAVVNVSKTPFHVHCDEKNEKTKESYSDSNRISAPKPVRSQRPNRQYESKIPVRKPAGLPRSRSVNPIRETAPPLTEVRSHSVDVPNTKTQVPKTSQPQVALPTEAERKSTATNKISKVSSKPVSKEVPGSSTFSKSSKPGGGSTRSLSTLRLRTGREYVFKKQVSVTHEIQKNEVTSNSKDTTSKRISEGRSEKIFFPKKEQGSRVTEMSTNSRPEVENLEIKSQRRSSLLQERILSGSIVTPVDGPPPAPLMPVKELIKRTRQTAVMKKQRESQGTIAGFSCPVELAYHMEYHADLLAIEKEREARAPQLSEHFLRRHINAHQRKEIVAYLIHLGVHCRYPSFAIYQTVKLFDIAMDRLAVRTERMQLTALAALWISLKKLEVYRKIPSAATIIALANEMYVGQEELLMVYEKKILQAVDFNITFADMFALLSHYIINLKLQIDISEQTTDLLYCYGGYMIDLTMLDERFCRSSASLVAFVVSELAMVLVQDSLQAVQALKANWRYDSIGTNCFTSDNFERVSIREAREINGLRAAIIRSIRDSGNKRSGYEVVYKKYNRSRYGGISRSLVERAKRLPSLDTTEF